MQCPQIKSTLYTEGAFLTPVVATTSFYAILTCLGMAKELAKISLSKILKVKNIEFLHCGQASEKSKRRGVKKER